MLAFSSEEVEPILASSKTRCESCGERTSGWKAWKVGGDARVPVCGWCLMYAADSQWGQDNKVELLHVGRLCVGMAAQHNRPIPELDERGRLGHVEAERFMMGVAFTSRMFVGALARIERRASGDDT
jgi:hypothetical protein